MPKLIKTKTWEELNNHLDRLKTALYTANKKISFYESELKEYENKSKGLMNEVFELSKELGSLKAENRILNNSLTAAEHCLVEKDSEIQRYSDQIGKIKDSILKYGK